MLLNELLQFKSSNFANTCILKLIYELFTTKEFCFFVPKIDTLRALEIKSTGYSAFFCSNFYELTNDYFSNIKNRYSNFVVLLDENTSKHCLSPLLIEIDFLKNALFIEIESGEQNKNINTCIKIWEQLSHIKADRNTLLINLGGGVICDLGGFVASTYKRGIDFVNFPTTLLAQVDASIGGKVGVDLLSQKNMVGLFSNPKAVFVYPAFTTTLSKRQLSSGFAEVIKHALIADDSLWKLIKKYALSANTVSPFIEKSIRIKNQVVKQDFEEKNLRKVLNFGHTIGHAIESLSLQKDKNPLLHGEAIRIGMLCESYLSHKIAGLSKKQFNEIIQYLIADLPANKIKLADFATLLDFMRNDKKNQETTINFSLLTEIGKCKINCTSSSELIYESLEFYRKLRG